MSQVEYLEYSSLMVVLSSVCSLIVIICLTIVCMFIVVFVFVVYQFLAEKIYEVLSAFEGNGMQT